MKFKLDENLPEELAPDLRMAGHDTDTVGDEHLLGAQTVRFTEAQSVKPDGLTRGEKWAIFGVVWVVVGIVGKLAT